VEKCHAGNGFEFIFKKSIENGRAYSSLDKSIQPYDCSIHSSYTFWGIERWNDPIQQNSIAREPTVDEHKSSHTEDYQ